MNMSANVSMVKVTEILGIDKNTFHVMKKQTPAKYEYIFNIGNGDLVKGYRKFKEDFFIYLNYFRELIFLYEELGGYTQIGKQLKQDICNVSGLKPLTFMCTKNYNFYNPQYLKFDRFLRLKKIYDAKLLEKYNG